VETCQTTSVRSYQAISRSIRRIKNPPRSPAIIYNALD
jgi:hypothetical protein